MTTHDLEQTEDSLQEPPATRPQKPVVAIVGRPNVGKSSLFNALLGRRSSIVSEVAGTTRDRLTADVIHMDRALLFADTGGLVPDPETAMEAHIAGQVAAAVDAADAVVLVVDALAGITYADEHVAQQLRRVHRPLVLAVNKVDSLHQEALAMEAHRLGLGDPIIVSALHRRGLDDLLDAVVDALDIPPTPPEPESPIASFAIIGRPNVGKSAFANAVLGMDRSIVSDIAGTTRDTLDTHFTFEDTEGVIVDTAGIRRRGAVERGIERYSVLRAVRAIDRADVAILIMDATEAATDQDLHIAGRASEAFKGLVAVVNKWDLAPEQTRGAERAMRAYVDERLRFVPSVPVILASAINGEGIDRALQAAFQVRERREAWLDPQELSTVMLDAIGKHMPPRTPQGGALKLYRVKQESVSPPTFVFYCNNADRVHFSYERYLANALRDHFEFGGVPLRLEFRGGGRIHVIGENRSKAVRGPRTPRTKGSK